MEFSSEVPAVGTRFAHSSELPEKADHGTTTSNRIEIIAFS
jgi:hypothetical protein